MNDNTLPEEQLPLAFSTEGADAPSNVVSLMDRRLEQETRYHTEGAAKCMECKHEWRFVAEWPFEYLECPQCGLHKGRPKFPYAPSNDACHLVCGRCGNEHLKPFLKGGLVYVICENCGNDVTDAFIP